MSLISHIGNANEVNSEAAAQINAPIAPEDASEQTSTTETGELNAGSTALSSGCSADSSDHPGDLKTEQTVTKPKTSTPEMFRLGFTVTSGRQLQDH